MFRRFHNLVYSDPLLKKLLNLEMKRTLHFENWSLRFDGKCINHQEYQVLVLKNEQRKVKLQAPDLSNGKADTVVKGITVVLDEYNLWKSIKMIAVDTTNVNTGRRNGIVTQLQRLFFKRISKNCNSLVVNTMSLTKFFT